MSADITVPDPREERLAQWAQHTMRALRDRLAAAEARLNAITDDPAGAPVTVRDLDYDPWPLPGHRPHVRFVVTPALMSDGRPFHPSHGWVEASRSDEQGGRTGVEVRGYSALSIRPISSNVVRIELDPRR